MRTNEATAGSAPVSIAIIGAGFAGVGMGISLLKAGISDFVILEKAGSAGGVWRDNTYPGAACDVPSHLYSFSFERRYRWTRVYSGQADIERYLQHCIDKYALAPHLRFSTEVKAVRFDNASGLWQIETAAGESQAARVVIMATGQLNRPAFPEIDGLPNFRGKVFHSARWDHDYDLSGKQVAVIGTGASAIQFVPRIVKQVAKLYLFQRSAPYVMPKIDHRITHLQHRLFDTVPFLYSAARAAIYAFYEFLGAGLVTRLRFLRYLPVGGAAVLNLRLTVRDPELRRKLTPDYPLGCKRILLANDFYPAVARPNVEVVTEGIRRVGADHVETADGRTRAVDAIILATGFKATELLAPIAISGREGRRLHDAWQHGADAYLGITVPGFPNLFILYGPNTNLGHNSIIYMIESQIRYVMQAVPALMAQPGSRLEVRKSVHAEFNRRLQAVLGRSIWASGCHSWYLNAEGKVVNNWAGFTFAYRRRTRRCNHDDYDFYPPGQTRAENWSGPRSQSLPARAARRVVRIFFKPALHARFSPVFQRHYADLATRTLLVPRDARFERAQLGGIVSERVSPRGVPAAALKAVIYLHGGGYILGSPRSHRSITGRLARSARVNVHVPDYRLAPEHPFPAAIEDALACYRALLDDGLPAEGLLVAGDSAGGGLALALMFRLRESGLPLPAGLLLISPWVDLTLENLALVEHDALLSTSWLRQCAAAYLGTTPARESLASPLFGDLNALPPTYIQCANQEILRNDSRRIATALAAAGVSVELDELTGMWHDFQLYAGVVPEATAALERAAGFVARQTKAIMTDR